MKLFGAAVLIVAMAFAGSAKAADAYPGQRDGDFTVTVFQLQNGEHLANARFHFTVLGTPARDATGVITNGVMLLHGTTGKLVAVNFADDLLNPAELGTMEAAMAHVKTGRYALIPASSATRGHQTLTLAAVWKAPWPT